MKKTIVQCDRCGVVYGDLDYIAPEVSYRGQPMPVALYFMGGNGAAQYGQSYPYIDLCPECRKSFIDWFNYPSLSGKGEVK